MTTVSFSTTVNCPSCNNINYVEIEALHGSGQIPKTAETCSSCSIPFTVMATVDIDVEQSK